MTRREQCVWVGVAVAALPIAMLIVPLGYRVDVHAPAVQLPLLALLAIAEEIVFRGGLQTLLARQRWLRFGVASLSGANLVTSAVFGAAHLLAHSPLQSVSVIPVSLLLGVAYERSGGLRLPAALHVAFNLALYLANVVAR